MQYLLKGLGVNFQQYPRNLPVLGIEPRPPVYKALSIPLNTNLIISFPSSKSFKNTCYDLSPLPSTIQVSDDLWCKEQLLQSETCITVPLYKLLRTASFPAHSLHHPHPTLHSLTRGCFLSHRTIYALLFSFLISLSPEYKHQVSKFVLTHNQWI